jgi:PAS domain S-box-containing protein
MVYSEKSPNDHVEILIAQDSSAQAAQPKHLLEGRGHAVTLAANGKQALAAARTHKPALIVSDIVMPEMDGHALCKSIKSEKGLKDVPVILMTTLSSPEDVVKGLECGADIFISKPCDKAVFLSRIDYALSNRTLREQAKLDMSLPIQLRGRVHYINSEPRQILDLLISTYEDAIQINAELCEKQTELTRLAEGLAIKVEERTAALRAEIGERKMAEEQLRESEEQFRLIAENITDLIAVLDLEGKRLYNSPSYKMILGAPAALRGSVSFNEIHPDDRERIRKIFQETVMSARGQRAEYRFLLRDGSVRFIESQGSVIPDEKGRTAKVLVVARDVT